MCLKVLEAPKVLVYLARLYPIHNCLCHFQSLKTQSWSSIEQIMRKQKQGENIFQSINITINLISKLLWIIWCWHRCKVTHRKEEVVNHRPLQLNITCATTSLIKSNTFERIWLISKNWLKTGELSMSLLIFRDLSSTNFFRSEHQQFKFLSVYKIGNGFVADAAFESQYVID